jgi:hypothetical protein
VAADLAALSRGLCTPERRQHCAAELGDSLEWSCRRCPSLPPEGLSPWTLHLLRLRQLRRAGYPFRPDDLPLSTWLSLGELEDALSTLRARSTWSETRGQRE